MFTIDIDGKKYKVGYEVIHYTDGYRRYTAHILTHEGREVRAKSLDDVVKRMREEITEVKL